MGGFLPWKERVKGFQAKPSETHLFRPEREFLVRKRGNTSFSASPVGTTRNRQRNFLQKS